MTNKYQEALQWLEKWSLSTASAKTKRIFKTIQESLQAGAEAEELGVSLDDLLSSYSEGRILPVLPNNYKPDDMEWFYKDGNVRQVQFRAFNGEIPWQDIDRFEDYVFGEGKTPAEAMQAAVESIETSNEVTVDKIGGCDAQAAYEFDQINGDVE